jgi:TonB family protein
MDTLPRGFLTSLPSILTAVSKAVTLALVRLLLEFARAISRVCRAIWAFGRLWVRRIWSAYYLVESKIVAFVCDALLTAYALRFFAVIAAIGLMLWLWHWWAFAVYALLILVAVVFYYRPEDSAADESNSRYRARLTPILRLSVRVMIGLVCFFLLHGPALRLYLHAYEGSPTSVRTSPTSTSEARTPQSHLVSNRSNATDKRAGLLGSKGSPRPFERRSKTKDDGTPRSPSALPATPILQSSIGELTHPAVNESGTTVPGDGALTVGNGVSAPSVLFTVDPQYSEEARKAKHSGTVLLSVIVDTGGRATDIHVLQSLGMGLDEKAMEAVMKWRFRPGMKDGVPVNVRARIEVNFRLL